VEILFRSISAPLATDVVDSVMPVTGTNGSGASIITIHEAVCPPGVLTVIVAVPGFLRSIMLVNDVECRGMEATCELLLVQVRRDGSSVFGNTNAVREAGVAEAVCCT
jgi:hypothetical protein